MGKYLDDTAVTAIENILASGCDVEIRSLKKGITVASVGKRVIYKQNADDRESTNKSRWETSH